MTKTVVITGANRGIGLALCRYYCAHGDTVIGVCRQTSADLAKLGVRCIAGIDVANADTVAELQATLADVSIDILINNAGILLPNVPLGELDYEAIKQQFMVNAMGPLRISEALLPCLASGSTIALITSRKGSMADNSSGGSYGYRMSKAALNAAGVSLAYDLKSRGIAVAILHPGWVKTDMTQHGGHVSAAEAAEQLAARIHEVKLDNTGSFWHANGEYLPW